jgi:hypothetical protein
MAAPCGDANASWNRASALGLLARQSEAPYPSQGRDHFQGGANAHPRSHESARLVLGSELPEEKLRPRATGSAPSSAADGQDVIADRPENAYYRMVTTYWDMAASFVVRI